MEIKIALVHGKYFNSWEALGLGYIGAYIKKHCPGVEILFYQGCFDDPSEIISGLQNVDIAFFSATSPSFDFCVDVSLKSKIKNPRLHSVVGGYHASALPVESLVEGIDQVVVGEGEKACVDIINGNRDKILYARRMDFSELVWPDRNLIKNHRNIDVSYRDNKINITSFQSTRGCPFMCKYCSDGHNKIIYNMGEKKVIIRDVEDLLEEMIYVTKKYNLNLLKFSDATWNISKDFVKEFCALKIRKNFNVPFCPNIHANVVDKEMFDLMVMANCSEIAIGVESGSPKILKQIGKGTSIESIRRACILARESNIKKIRGYFILGMPDETEEDLKMTEEFADSLPLDEYGFTILCPYPGSTMYSENKHLLQSIKWSETDEYRNDFWFTKHLSNSQLRDWQNRLVKKFKDKITWHNKILMENVNEKT